MHVDSSTVTSKSGKRYERHLIRQAYRDEQGKPRQRTIANISKCSAEEIGAIKLALKHKGDLTQLVSVADDVSFEQGLSVGAVWTLWTLARELGVADALGDERQGKLALWQVVARIIDQGSRLSAVRLAGAHAACDVLDLDNFNEDNLYSNLDWLCENQADIEARLFRKLYPEHKPKLFLYDVTSSYLEGMENELAAFGYNRDGKRGKMQIVIGLLCDEAGVPLSIEVFEGNTADTKTFSAQVSKASARFGAESVTFVGDRGMIKGPQIDELPEGCHYITAITKPQIQKLVREGLFQPELFDEDLAEIDTDEGIRYILRRNPIRADEIAASRRDKLAAAAWLVADRNGYLAKHPRAKVATARKAVETKLAKLKLDGWVQVTDTDRRLELREDANALAEQAKFDGCYVIKTDLDHEAADKETVHDRYKDLAKVEWAFRTSKTVLLENRPIHVRLASRTRGHVFVVMLAYRLVHELSRRWQTLDTTVAEAIDQLSTLCTTKMLVRGEVRCHTIAQPRPDLAALLDAAGVTLPDALPSKNIKVATRKKLTSRRKKR